MKPMLAGMQMSGRPDEPIGTEATLWGWDGFLPRSYLFSADPLAIKPRSLREVAVPRGHLFVSPDYECCVQRLGTSLIILIGHCVDLSEPEKREADIAASLLQQAQHDGIDRMLVQTDDLFGRFAVICHIAGQWHAFADACATRTIYFAEDRAAIASHSTLLGELTGAAPRADIFRHFWCALPGNASPVEGVRILPANFVLDLGTRTIRRFWPRRARVERTTSDVVDEVDSLLGKAADAVVARWKPALSLTAGLDSRLSLSVYHGFRELLTFTYERHSDDTRDFEVARELSRRLGIEHRRLPPVDRSRAQKAYEMADRIVDCAIDRNIAPICLSGLQDIDEPLIHVRSSLAEIGRAFWRYHPGMPTRFDPSNWMQVALAKSKIDLPHRQKAIALMRDEMPRFFSTVGYDSLDPRSPEIMGYDAWDLAYVEHRMSTWHGPALLAYDMISDTSIIFNFRRLLELLLSVPLPDRRQAALFRAIIKRRCPQISGVPINPRPRRSIGQLMTGVYRQLKRRTRLIQAVEGHFSH
jgi:hypothetical protein